MAKPKQTSQKGDREKKKKLKQKEKDEKREERKKNSNKGKGIESMMAYIDHNGNLSSTPPDPKLKFEIRAEDIQLGPQSIVREKVDNTRSGRIAIFYQDRMFGFIKDSITQEKVFFHYSAASFEAKEGDLVTYELTHGPKGASAINVEKTN